MKTRKKSWKVTKAPQAPQRKSTEARRTCLSGIGKPHKFLSQHSAHRICPKCAPQIEQQRRAMGRLYHCYVTSPVGIEG